MRALFFALFLAACGGSSGSVDQAPASQPDLVHEIGDGGTPSVDQAPASSADLAHPAGDLAEAAPDLAPACGGAGQPCCGTTSACVDGHYPNGSFCEVGTCTQGGTTSAFSTCYMEAGTPTCEPCGGTEQLCCAPGQLATGTGEPGAAGGQCVFGDSCAPPASSQAGHCG